MPGNGERAYQLYGTQLYGTVYERFTNTADKPGIPAGFTPHSLRHAFASAMLSKASRLPTWRTGSGTVTCG